MSGPSVTTLHGDCLDVLRELPDASVDAIVTDPPYGLGFMGKAWDALPPGEEWATECLRVLKPGGHLLAFGGTRTWHRLAVAVEDAGFEVRDSIAWLYGSGFPKSLDVSKAIDKAAGVEREVVEVRREPFKVDEARKSAVAWNAAVDATGDTRPTDENGYMLTTVTAPATAAARTWQGWGTALKPAFEPIVVARKPLVGTVAGNVLAHGTGALNIDGCRIDHDAASAAWVEKWSGHEGHPEQPGWGTMGQKFGGSPAGRWPANVILDESQAAALDQQSGTLTSGANPTRRGADGDRMAYGEFGGQTDANPQRGVDVGGASRFYYCAKASTRERVAYFRHDCACEGPAVVTIPTPVDEGSTCSTCGVGTRRVAHPTVKPLGVMRWLVRLVTPPGGRVLDPFGGTGTTGEACLLEGFDCTLVERDGEYHPLIGLRLDRSTPEPEPPAEPVELINTDTTDAGDHEADLLDLLEGEAS